MPRPEPDYSKDFFELIKYIGDARTKQDEDRIILSEIRRLKEKMSAKDVKQRNMREYLVRMLYVEMLGHDASFGHIQAVKMVSSRNIFEKRIGYLAVCLTLHKDHEFMMLLVNAFQTDLKSDNFLEICMALHAVSKLVNADIIPAVMPLVVSLLSHKQSIVRKKAVICLQRFHQLNPTCLVDLNDLILKSLCDNDPSVMGASLVLLKELVKVNPHEYKIITQSLVGILKQIIEHRLPREFDYHRLPAPWLQIHILQLFAALGKGDRKTSELIFDVLADVLRRAAVNTNIGYSIVYQCVKTVTSIYPNTSLLQSSAEAVAHFLTSSYHNLKYIGVTSLIDIVKIDPQHASAHQMVVIDCLESRDETLQRKTLELLYYMTNPSNIVAIVDIMIKHLNLSVDAYLRSDLSAKIMSLCEQYAPSAAWYVLTVSRVMEYGGQDISPSKSYGVINFLTELAPDDSDPDSVAEVHDVRIGLTNEFISKLQLKTVTIPDCLMKTVAWVIGEYGILAEYDPEDILMLLLDRFKQTYADHTVRHWILQAITRVISQIPSDAAVPSEVVSCIQDCVASHDTVLHHIALESSALLQHRLFLIHIANQQKSQQSFSDLIIDVELPFLDKFVDAALKKGARRYDSSLLADPSAERPSKGQGLRFDAYERVNPVIKRATPVAAAVSTPSTVVGGHPTTFDQGHGQPATVTQPVDDTKIQIRAAPGKGKWGPKGFNNPKPAAAPVFTASPSQSSSVHDQSYSSNAKSFSSASASSSPSSYSSAPNQASSAGSPFGDVSFKPRRPQPDASQDPKRKQAASSLFAGVTTTGGSSAGGAKPKSSLFTSSGGAKMTFKSNVNLKKTTAATATTSTPSSATPSTPATTTNTPAKSPNAPLDLLFDTSTSSTTATTTPPSTGTTNNLDILLFPSSTTATSPSSANNNTTMGIDLLNISSPSSPQQPTTTTSGGSDAFDLLGMSTMAQTPPSSISSPHQGGGGGSGVDLFNFQSMTTSSPSSPLSAPGKQSPAASGVESILTNQLHFSPNDASQQQFSEIIVSHQHDSHVRVAYNVVSSGNTHGAVVIYVTNTSPLSHHHQPSMRPQPVSFALSSPSNFQLKAVGGVSAEDPSTVVKPLNDSTFTFSLPQFTTVAMVFSITGASLLALPQIAIPLTFSGCSFATTSSSPSKTTVSLDLTITSKQLLSPLQIATRQYAELWKSFGAATEAKSSYQLSSSVTLTNDIIAQALSMSCLHPVQTIKQETIAASVLIGGSATTPQHVVLLHAKILDAKNVHLHARSRMSNASQGIIDDFKRSLGSL